MDASSEAADQIVRMALQGTEVALRITGAGAKNAAAIIAAAAASSHKTRGKARLASLLRSGKELRVFPIRHADLHIFAKEARRYGIVYTVVKQNGEADSVDLLVRAEDASKVNRIAERNSFARVRRDAPETRESPTERKRIPEPPKEPGPNAALPPDEPLSRPGGGEGERPFANAPTASPPSGRTSKKKRQSERGGSRCNARPSVRAEMRSIRRERNLRRPPLSAAHPRIGKER